MKKFYIILFLISLFSLWPFFNKGFFESHDGEWMVIRFSAFHQTLASGQFPVRFVDRLNNNYGYPVFNFLYPLPFYLAEVPKLLGFGYVNSVKLIFILSTISSSLAMYWALRQLYKEIPSLVGAIFYVYIPYRFVDLYVRGSLGEIVALAIVPFLFGSILKLCKNKKIFQPSVAFFTFLLIISHNVLAVLFLPLFFLSAFILTRKYTLKIISAMILGTIASAFYWVPALHDLKYVQYLGIEISNVTEHLVTLSRLIIPSWGYGTLPSGISGFSPQIGLISITAILASLYVIFSKKIKNSLAIYLLLITFICIALMTKYSQVFWQNLPLIDTIQFPWRLLAIVVFSTSVLGAFSLNQLKKPTFLAIGLIFLAIIFSASYTKPANFVNRDEGFYFTNEDTTTVLDEYMPIWVNSRPEERANEKIITDNNSRILKSNIKPALYEATIDANDESEITINTIYFPGWSIKAGGIPKTIDYHNQLGLIKFKLPTGIHEVIIKYNKTPIHLISEIISLFSLAGIGIYFIYLWKRQSF